MTDGPLLWRMLGRILRRTRSAPSAGVRGIAGDLPTVGPATLHLDVTNGCDAACVTCWDHSPLLREPRPAEWKRGRADVAARLALVDEVQALGALEAVIVSGMGEPFTHPGLADLLAGLKGRGLHVTVITNLLAADAGRILELGIDSLLVGLHAADAAGYRAFHPGCPDDAWERILAKLGRFRDAGRRDKHVQVICATNADRLEAMVDLAADYRAGRVNFKLASLAAGTERVRIDAGQRSRLLAEGIPAAVARAESRGVTTNLATFRDQVSAGGAATAPIRETGCYMGHLYARVAVDGTAYFCCNTETAVGRVGEGTRFSDLWRGAAWAAMRERLRAGDFFPGCERCGKFEQNAKIAAKLKALEVAR